MDGWIAQDLSEQKVKPVLDIWRGSNYDVHFQYQIVTLPKTKYPKMLSRRQYPIQPSNAIIQPSV